MRNFKVELKNFYNVKGGVLNCYITDHPFDEPTENFSRPAVVICAGGGYYYVSNREKEPVGSYFVYSGFQVFILDYVTMPEGAKYPEQLYELGSSVDYIKRNHKSLNVNPDRIYCVGFSAGGHLVGNLAVEYDKVDKALSIDSKPTATGLCYPVITPKSGHTDSFENLLTGYCKEEKEKLLNHLALDELVDSNTPPAFIWCTAEDSCVSPINSLLYAASLVKNNVAFELHIYPEGRHGLSACTQEICEPIPYLDKNSQWLKDMSDFFKKH